MVAIGADSDDQTRPPRDRVVAALAHRQHGVVARRQLLAAGVGVGAIKRRVSNGRLIPLHRGVYAVGHRKLAVSGCWMAAVLACGSRALLSHRSAAALWQIAPIPSGAIDVTVPGHGRRRPGINVHRTRALHAEDRSLRDGIPVTSVRRTLVDLADVVDDRPLERAIEQAERLRLLDASGLGRNGRHGVEALRRALAIYADPGLTRSELERRFLELCRSAGLPMPATNVPVGGYEADAVWRRQRLVVELDGFEFHRTRAAFERDRRRDLVLQRAGYRVVRVTAKRLADDPGPIVAALLELLG